MSWEDAWREGRTGWDAGASSPLLVELVEQGSLPEGRALVPGCGAGHDVFTLATEGREVVGLDLAPTAGERFRALRDERGVPAERAQIEIADFFEYAPEAPFDLVWDYTFLCAIDPSQRPAWVEKMDALLADGGELITLLFPATKEPPFGAGPPFALPPDEIRELLSTRFTPSRLEPVTQSHEGRRGMEWIGRWRRK